MAKKKSAEPKIVLERVYNVPLRDSFIVVPRQHKAKRAVSALKIFLARHMKSKSISIGSYANQAIWARGIRNPPHHIKVRVKKDEAGKVFAELEGAPVKEKAPHKFHARKAKEAAAEKKAESGAQKGSETKEKIEKLEEALESSKEKKSDESKIIEHEEIAAAAKEHHHAKKEPVQQKNIDKKPTAPSGRSEMRKP